MDYPTLPPFTLLDEPNLSFSPLDDKLDIHPLRGLAKFGPYSNGSFGRFTSKIRLATIWPKYALKTRDEIMQLLKSTHLPTDRKAYVIEYKGFKSLFKLALEFAPCGDIKWDVPSDFPREDDQDPQFCLYQAMEAAFRQLSLQRNAFDVALVYFPNIWNRVTRSKFFDAHDALKALGAKYNIPTQVLNDEVFEFEYKASLAWRLSIALYVKAGGTPWKLAPLKGVPENTAYIGLAYALRVDQHDTHYVNCCSQVFDMDGGGMQFVAFEAQDPVSDTNEARRNPFLSRDDMRRVVELSLSLYRKRNGGNLPRRIVIHKTTAFKESEIEGAFEALRCVQEIECVEINSACCWRGVWLIESSNSERKSEPSEYPVPRGAMVIRSGNSALVWVAGNAKGVTNYNYYQGGKSIPRPLQLVRHAGSGSLELTAREMLALTKMDWNMTHSMIQCRSPFVIHKN